MSASAGERETPPWASCFPVAALGAWAVLRIGTWFARDYTHDDFYFAYLSWLRAIKARPGVDFDVLLYTPLIELFSPVYRLSPESFLPLDLARALILVVALALLGLVYVLSRRLGASPTWALCAVSFTAWQGDFLLRISDVRTDAIATLFLLVAFLLLLHRDVRRPLLAGVCFGTAVFFNIKLAVGIPAVGLLVVLTSMKTPVRSLLRFAAGAVIGTLLWDGVRALSDGWGPILIGLRALLRSPPTGTALQATEFLQRAIQNAPISVLLLVFGALGTIAIPFLHLNRQGFRAGAGDPRLVFGFSAILFVAVYLRTNPFLFSYNFVVLMPVLGTLLPGLPTLLPRRFPPVARAGLIALATLLPVSEGIAALSATYDQTNLAQRRLVKWIWDATDPSERVFDWQGMHWGRHGTYHWWMFSGWVPAYQAGKLYSVADELKASQVTLVIDNYRLGWFHRADREFFQSHYVRLDYCLLVPGRTFSADEVRKGTDFDLVASGFYRLDSTFAIAAVLIDGKPAATIQRLSAGPHRLSLALGAAAVPVRVTFSTPRRERFPLPCPTPVTLFYGF